MKIKPRQLQERIRAILKRTPTFMWKEKLPKLERRIRERLSKKK